MEKIQNKKNFFIGLSLTNSSNYDSGVVVLDENLQIVLLDKLYSNEDIQTFFNNFNSLSNSVVAITLPSDNSMLDGKWRIQSKNYKAISEGFEINNNNWTKRLSTRGCEIFGELKLEGFEIFRYFNYQIRESYGLNPHYSERTSLDCKSLQTSLKVGFNFKQLPENMLPASNLEAILGAMFAYDVYQKQNFKKIFEFENLDVLQRVN